MIIFLGGNNREMVEEAQTLPNQMIVAALWIQVLGKLPFLPSRVSNLSNLVLVLGSSSWYGPARYLCRAYLVLGIGARSKQFSVLTKGTGKADLVGNQLGYCAAGYNARSLGSHPWGFCIDIQCKVRRKGLCALFRRVSSFGMIYHSPLS